MTEAEKRANDEQLATVTAERDRLRELALAELPPEVRLALMVILNHVEPGWDNCVATVRGWLSCPLGGAAKVKP